MNNEIFHVYLEDILPNRFQPRKKFNDKKMGELAESIQQHGIINPLIVRRLGEKYEIIAGERRYKAATLAGLEKVPVIIKEMDDKESAEVALVENVQRQDLTAIEEAESYNKLMNLSGITQEEIARKVGVTQPTVANKIRLLNLSEEVQEALLHKKISERHARSLLSIDSKENQNKLLAEIIAKKMTVRQLDKVIKGEPEEVIPPIIKAQEDIKPIPEKIESIDEEIPTLSFVPIAPTSVPKEDVIEPVPEVPVNEPIAPTSVPEEEVIEPVPEVPVNEPMAAMTSIPVVTTMFDPLPDPSIEPEPVEELPVEEVIEAPVAPPVEEPVEMAIPSMDPMPEPIPQIPEEEVIEEKTEELPIPTAVIEATEIPKEPKKSYINFGIEPVVPVEEDIPTITLIPVEESIVQPTNVESIIKEFKEQKTQELPGIPEMKAMEEPSFSKEVEPAAPTKGEKLKEAVASIKATIKETQDKGFKIDIEEFDFEESYQIIVKVEK